MKSGPMASGARQGRIVAGTMRASLRAAATFGPLLVLIGAGLLGTIRANPETGGSPGSASPAQKFAKQMSQLSEQDKCGTVSFPNRAAVGQSSWALRTPTTTNHFHRPNSIAPH